MKFLLPFFGESFGFEKRKLVSIYRYNGTVLEYIVKTIPKESVLHSYFFGQKWSLEEIEKEFFQDLKNTLSSYKKRLFCSKSLYSDKLVSVLADNLSVGNSDFSSVLAIITRFMGYKNLTESPGELAQRLSWLWQAGLWVMSQHAVLYEKFFYISGVESDAPLLKACVWAEYFLGKQSVPKITVGDYLMKIAVETECCDLKKLLVERGFVCLNTPSVKHDVATLCYLGSFSEALDSLESPECEYKELDGECSRSTSYSSTGGYSC